MPRPKRRDPFRVFYRAEKKCWVVEYGHGKERGQKNVPQEIRGKDAVMRWANENYGEGEPIPVKRDTSSLSALFDKWIEARWVEARRVEPRFSPSTVKANESHGKKWIKPKLGDMPAQEVGPSELRSFIRTMRDEGAGPQTVRNHYYSLVAFLDDAMADGWVKHASNPARHPGVLKEVPPPPDRRGGQKVVTLPIEHAQDLIHGYRVPLTAPIIPLNRRAAYVLECTLGIRPGEGPGLCVGDVDIEGGTIEVVRQLGLVTPGTRTGKELRKPKRNSKRRLPLHPAAIEALTEWLAEWEVFVGRKPKPTDPLFPNEEGKPTRNRQAERLRKDLERLGLPTTSKGQNVTAQAVRRSVSSWLKKRGVAKEDRGRLLGHADASVTEQHYTDDDLTPLRKALELLPFTWRRSESSSGGDSQARTSSSGDLGSADSNAAADSKTPGGELPSGENAAEVRIGFEPTYDGFANRDDDGPRVATSARDSDEEAEEPPSRTGLTGRTYSQAGSVSTPRNEGFAAGPGLHRTAASAGVWALAFAARSLGVDMRREAVGR